MEEIERHSITVSMGMIWKENERKAITACTSMKWKRMVVRVSHYVWV